MNRGLAALYVYRYGDTCIGYAEYMPGTTNTFGYIVGTAWVCRGYGSSSFILEKHSTPDSLLEENQVLKRNYQSSREVRKMKKIGAEEDRRKIELTESNAIAFSLGIVDSLCSSDEDSSLNSNLCTPFVPTDNIEPCSRSSSTKARFSPIRSLINPFTKSKSQRSPLGPASGSRGLPLSRMSSLRRTNTLRKSSSNDFSNTMHSPDFGSQFVKRDLCKNSAVSGSPGHLHGCLKLETKHGVPFFEFSLNFTEDIFMAQTWKTEDALNLVYTFHNRRKSNAGGWGLKNWNKEYSMVGQMKVSCYLCTELKDVGAFDNSMVTEFVLYDVVHGVVRPPKSSNQSPARGTCELDDVPDQSRLKLQPKHVVDNTHFDSSTPKPWAPKDLHPSLEIAAIVIQVPFGKSDQTHPNLLDLSAAEKRKEGILDCSSPTKVNVVVPFGNHSLPNNENHGPSPLLDRWRLGGGCDCGGWDVACPLTVFGNPNIQSAEDHRLMENQQPLELFVQGSKENTPALTMTVIEEGWYSVDFHAQLSPLQAFSICVAILHGTEASIAVGQERANKLLKRNSLKVFIEEEVKILIDAVTEEEKRKAIKKMEEIPKSFKLNPPFSPIDRA
ncbi:unnamed protein product [Camellia sinensis]